MVIFLFSVVPSEDILLYIFRCLENFSLVVCLFTCYQLCKIKRKTPISTVALIPKICMTCLKSVSQLKLESIILVFVQGGFSAPLKVNLEVEGRKISSVKCVCPTQTQDGGLHVCVYTICICMQKAYNQDRKAKIDDR